MYETLANLAASDYDDENFVSVTLSIAAPFDVSYTISAFLADGKMEDDEVFTRRVEKLGGVDANFECSLDGNITYPDSLKDYKFQLLVNPLAGSTYLDYATRNCIGDGWYQHDTFLFRLYLDPQMTSDLFRCIELKSRLPSADFLADEKKLDAWAIIRLDLVEIAEGNQLLEGAVTYRIRRLYA